MKRMTGIGAGLAAATLATIAFAQPTITSLGSGTPTGVSNLTSGNYYMTGSGIVTTQVGRWTFTPGTSSLTAAELGGAATSYGMISSDGAYMMGLFPNNTPQIFGKTATGVSPIFSTTPTLVTSTTQPAATETICNRWSASSNSWTRLAPLPTDTRLCYGSSTVSQLIFGSGSSGGSTSSFLDGNAMSQNGRFIAGYAYICTYSSSAGTTISASTFRWNPFIWDASTNTTTVLPLPVKQSANWRSRTGRAYAVSNDGQVVVGYQEHNVSSSLAADPDGARPLVWRWNSTTSQYDMSYLPTGTSGGQFYTMSATAGTIFVNAAGTIIVGRNVSDTGFAYLCKWTWDAGTSTWTANNIGTNVGATSNVVSVTCPSGIPTVTTTANHNLALNDRVYLAGNTTPAYNGMWLVSNVTSPTTFEISGSDGSPKACGTDGTGGTVNKAASWLPAAVYLGCGASTNWGVPPALSPTGMSDDGNTVIGTATYSACGSFQQGGFVWHASDGVIQDWYDYCVAQGVPTVGTGTYYGPIGDNSDPTRGMPRLGAPLAINPEGSAFVGRQGGTTIIVPSAGPWIMVLSGGATCVPPQFTLQPTASVATSLCASSLGTILNVAASGTGPLTYQWYKNSGSGPVALTEGATGYGSTITGTTTVQLRILNIRPADVGNYTCVATGCNELTATSTPTAITVDSTQATPANNDCAAAVSMGEGTVNWNICAAWANQGGSCATDLASVWYRYTPTFTGDARFQTCASTFDTTIQLYDQCNGSQLESGCNDDVGARGLAGLGAACSSTRSVISRYPVTSGVPIYVRVGAKTFPGNTTNSATSGAMTISQAPAAPANDLCSGATVVAAVPSNSPFNVNEATDDFNIGVSSDSGATTFCGYGVSSYGTASNRDVWFLLDSPCHAGGTYTIDTCGSTMTNPMLHVFAGTCDGLQLFGNNACADSVGSGVSGCTSQQARISNLVTYGPVYIRVSQSGTGSPGTAATSGTGVLNITGTHTVCGACCDSGGLCTLAVSTSCGGSYKGDGTVCAPNPCTGVCCRGSTCTITSQSLCQSSTTTLSTGGPGWSFVSASNICNTPGNVTSPCCYANYNHNATLEVQDIFDFLNDWFAGKKIAIVGGNGDTGTLAVQNIFDFLNAWFAGGCN